MRLSELAGKEMVDVQSGSRIGVLGGADLEICEETGRVYAIVIEQGGGFSFGKKRESAVIPWEAIVKVGPELIILDSEQTSGQRRAGALGTPD
ncbi:MAG TPA: YlmC/YmxH family sporulation protein [Bacilli bacterium]|nr:YlmC/YmxH family sporulation protein [Bacilli bacterium]